MTVYDTGSGLEGKDCGGFGCFGCFDGTDFVSADRTALGFDFGLIESGETVGDNCWGRTAIHCYSHSYNCYCCCE